MDTGVAWLPSARAVKWKFGFKKRAQPLTLITNVCFYVYIKDTAVLSQMKVGITSSRYDLSYNGLGTLCATKKITIRCNMQVEQFFKNFCMF